MNITVSPSRAAGTVAAPPSKSMAHRLLIAAALAKGTSQLCGVSVCEDVLATVDCLNAMGISCQRTGDRVTVSGNGIAPRPVGDLILPCRESGSTMRFLLPVALLCDRPVKLVGAPSLLARPMSVYETLCRENGLYFVQTAEGITVKGPLQAGDYTLPGNISSQFISGMLFALTQCQGKSTLHILPPIESRSYILLTLRALALFGADVKWLDDCTLAINGDARMHGFDATVEGDYSNAAFLEAFNLFGGNVTVTGLDPASLQGDRVYRQCFEALQTENAVLSLEDCPDLAPILFAVAAAGKGGRFTDTRRLRIKESDRAAVMAEELCKLGATVRVLENEVEVIPTAFHAPTEPLCGHNDHRIVMSLTVLLSLVGGTLTGAEAVRKSFPDFFDRIRTVGISVTET